MEYFQQYEDVPKVWPWTTAPADDVWPARRAAQGCIAGRLQTGKGAATRRVICSPSQCHNVLAYLWVSQVKGLAKRLAVIEQQLTDNVLDDFKLLMGTADVKVSADARQLQLQEYLPRVPAAIFARGQGDMHPGTEFTMPGTF